MVMKVRVTDNLSGEGIQVDGSSLRIHLASVILGLYESRFFATPWGIVP